MGLGAEVEAGPAAEAVPDDAEAGVLRAQELRDGVDLRARDVLVVALAEGEEVEGGEVGRGDGLAVVAADGCESVRDGVVRGGRMGSQVWDVDGGIDFAGIEIGQTAGVMVLPIDH